MLMDRWDEFAVPLLGLSLFPLIFVIVFTIVWTWLYKRSEEKASKLREAAFRSLARSEELQDRNERLLDRQERLLDDAHRLLNVLDERFRAS